MKKSDCLHAILEIVTEPLIVTDVHGIILAANNAGLSFLNISQKDLIGTDIKKYFVDTLELDLFYTALTKEQKIWRKPLTLSGRRKEFRVVCVDIYSRILPNDQEFKIFIKIFNINSQQIDLQQAEMNKMNMQILTHFDEDHIPYKYKFLRLIDYDNVIEKMKYAINYAQKNTENFVVFILDIDKFSLINQHFDIHMSDFLIRKVEQRLLEFIQYPNTINKIGSDEYLMIFYDISAKENVFSLCKKILKTIAEKYSLKNERYFLTASIGVSIYSETSYSASDLLRYANIALKKSKELGGDRFQIINSKEIAINLGKHLCDAIINDEFFLEFQPVFDLKYMSVYKIEALFRWRTKSGAIKYPEAILPDIERFQLMEELCKYVVEKSLLSFKKLQQEHNYRGGLAINFSLSQLSAPLVNFLDKKLHQYNIKHELIWIELNENSFVSMNKENKKMLAKIEKLGIKISIDDFGIKYSSLSYFHWMKIDEIKIDKVFIAGIPDNTQAIAILSGIFSMSKLLNISVVAEGIENSKQLKFLVDNYCGYGQGYFLSHPLNLDKLIEFLRAQCYRLN